ncbi:unnamed protein product [Arctogadus glacialis]
MPGPILRWPSEPGSREGDGLDKRLAHQEKHSSVGICFFTGNFLLHPKSSPRERRRKKRLTPLPVPREGSVRRWTCSGRTLSRVKMKYGRVSLKWQMRDCCGANLGGEPLGGVRNARRPTPSSDAVSAQGRRRAHTASCTAVLTLSTSLGLFLS